MKLTGKLDYLEMPATGGTLDTLKAFYSAAFSWSFTDYGRPIRPFRKVLTEAFRLIRGSARQVASRALLRGFGRALGAVENAGGTIVKPIFSFPGGRRFHFVDPAGNEMAVWGE